MAIVVNPAHCLPWVVYRWCACSKRRHSLSSMTWIDWKGLFEVMTWHLLKIALFGDQDSRIQKLWKTFTVSNFHIRQELLLILYTILDQMFFLLFVAIPTPNYHNTVNILCTQGSLDRYINLPWNFNCVFVCLLCALRELPWVALNQFDDFLVIQSNSCVAVALEWVKSTKRGAARPAIVHG